MQAQLHSLVLCTGLFITAPSLSQAPPPYKDPLPSNETIFKEVGGVIFGAAAGSATGLATKNPIAATASGYSGGKLGEEIGATAGRQMDITFMPRKKTSTKYLDPSILKNSSDDDPLKRAEGVLPPPPPPAVVIPLSTGGSRGVR